MSQSNSLEEDYANRFTRCLIPLAIKLESLFTEITEEYPRVDRVSSRAKEISSFLNKANKKIDDRNKYGDPLNDIFDQIGVRIVVNYNSDLEPICNLVEKYFGPIEKLRKEPELDDEFGYEGFHYILFIPPDLFTSEIDNYNCPKFFELQIKTLFQHAWAQADHDLLYKPQIILNKDQKKRIAFTAAQAWGADEIFDELFRSIQFQLNQNE